MRAPPIRPSGITALKEPSIAVWLCRAFSRDTETEKKSMNGAMTPFTLAVPQAELEDLNRKDS